MDTLYIGDIPSDYHYAVFSNDYVTLYRVPTAQNTDLDYYRIYFNYDGFFYSTGTTHVNNFTTYQDISVTDSFWYRPDISNIVQTSFLLFFMIIFVFNLITSFVRRGGILGGLL